MMNKEKLIEKCKEDIKYLRENFIFETGTFGDPFELEKMNNYLDNLGKTKEKPEEIEKRITDYKDKLSLIQNRILRNRYLALLYSVSEPQKYSFRRESAKDIQSFFEMMVNDTGLKESDLENFFEEVVSFIMEASKNDSVSKEDLKRSTYEIKRLYSLEYSNYFFIEDKINTTVTKEEVYFMICFFMHYSLISEDNATLIFIRDVFDRAGIWFDASYIKWLDYMYMCFADYKPCNLIQDDKICMELVQKETKAMLDEFFKPEHLQTLKKMQATPNRHGFYNFVNDINSIIVPNVSDEKRVLALLNTNKYNTKVTKRIQLYFWGHWFAAIMDNGEDRKALWSEMFRNAGFEDELATFPTIESVITYNALSNKLSCTEWFREQGELLTDQTDEKPALQMIETPTVADFKYDNWVKSIIEPGLETADDIQTTRKSINYLRENINDWSKSADRHYMISLIKDAELRRQWYFNRIINYIISVQTNHRDIFEQRSDNPYVEWVFSSETKATLQNLTNWINNTNNTLTTDRIAASLDWCFDITNYKYAFATINFRKKAFDPSFDPLMAEIRRNNTHEQRIRSMAGRELGEMPIGRNLLLLMVLLGKMYGVDKLTMDYVKYNIMVNSRYSEDLENENSPFISYFLDTFERLDNCKNFYDRVMILRQSTGQFEINYVRNDTAILNQIFLGKA